METCICCYRQFDPDEEGMLVDDVDPVCGDCLDDYLEEMEEFEDAA